MKPARVLWTAVLRRPRADPLDRIRKPVRGHPQGKPAIAETSCSLEGRIGAAADKHRDRGVWGWADPGVLNVEESAAETDLVPGQQTTDEVERLGRACTTGSRVDAAQLELVRVIATDADPEREPSGRDQRDRRELTGDGRRVAESQQVDPGLNGQGRMGGQQRTRLDQPVNPVTAGEADVVADGEVVDAGVGCGGSQLAEPAAPVAQILLSQNDADSDAIVGRGGTVGSGAPTLCQANSNS